MCLAIPAQIAAIDAATQTARVSLGGVTKEISLALVDDVVVGDYVLVHVGYALNRLSEEEAARTLALISEAGMLAEEDLGVSPPQAGQAGGGA
ncbi:MAG: HypC/HybG/HupF family hydrogenase formation chaperone [Bdellovibrio bacteriovorus]